MGNILYSCHKTGKKHPKWSYNAVMYELNTRQFTPEGTFNAAAKELPRLAKLGVGVIWMMPIFPIGKERRKGSLGSYYSIADYSAINEEFGTLADFQNFTQQAHDLGMRVIIDWVANHTARDARWTREHPDWYIWDTEKGEIATPFDWSDTAKLDYNNGEMRAEMVRSMRFWLREALIDGFRCDMAMLVPTEFWEHTTAELEQEMALQGRELFMLAEAEGAEFHNSAFDATYAWEMHHTFNKVARGEANCYALGERLAVENSIFLPSDFRMQFTSNHDENSWNGSAITRMRGAAKPFAALTFILSGIPLIYNGQEFGLSRSLEFFDSDPIEWNKLTDTFNESINDLYTELCSLKKSHPALAAGDRGGDIYAVENSEPWRIFAIKRKVEDRVVIGIFNMSSTPADIEFYDTDFSGDYQQIGSTQSASLASNHSYHLASWGFSVYYK